MKTKQNTTARKKLLVMKIKIINGIPFYAELPTQLKKQYKL